MYKLEIKIDTSISIDIDEICKDCLLEKDKPIKAHVIYWVDCLEDANFYLISDVYIDKICAEVARNLIKYQIKP